MVKYIHTLFKSLKMFIINFKRIAALVWESSPVAVFLMMLIAIIRGLQPVATALVNKNIIDNIIQANHNIENIVLLLLIQILLIIVTYACSATETTVNSIVGNKLTNNIKLKIMNKMREIDFSAYDIPGFYNKVENANNEAGYRPLSILGSSFYFCSLLISFFSLVVILSSFNKSLMIIIIVLSIPSAYISYKFKNETYFMMTHKSKERRQMGYISSLFTNKDYFKEIKLNKTFDYLISKYLNIFYQYHKDYKKIITKQGIWSFIFLVISILGSGSTYVYITMSAIDGRITIGDFSLYSSSVFQIEGTLLGLITTITGLFEGSLFINNLFSFFSEPSNILNSQNCKKLMNKSKSHFIELRNVTFKYPNSLRNTIENISFKIEAGETIALVGLNGAGKSTLIKLLLRFYDPNEGEILIDGHNIKDIDIDSLHSMFSVVFQDFCRYSFTVDENIGLGQVDIINNQNAISSAAQKSGAHEFIQKLTHNYSTYLTRSFEADGVELSLGQWQKIALARAFFREADILILDEPTSSLDPKAESEVFRKFDELRGNRTTIFISHRLSNATIASRIVYIENGRITELGTHKELMDLDGEYAKLFKSQAERYSDCVSA